MGFWEFLTEFSKTEVMRVTVIKTTITRNEPRRIKTVKGEHIEELEDKRIIDI